MNDDLNTAVALSVMFDLVKSAERLLDSEETTKETCDAVDRSFRRMGGDVLGIVRDAYADLSAGEHQKLKQLLDALMKKRTEARKRKKYDVSDAIRDATTEANIQVFDSPDGTSGWKL